MQDDLNNQKERSPVSRETIEAQMIDFLKTLEDIKDEEMEIFYL